MNPIELFGRKVHPTKNSDVSFCWMASCHNYHIVILDIKEDNDPRPIKVNVYYLDNDINDSEPTEYEFMDDAINAVKNIIFKFMEEEARVKQWVGYKRY